MKRAVDQESIEAHGAVMQMATGFWVSQIVRTAADLSLAEHLQDGPRTAAHIAALESSDPTSTFRLMRACVSLGLLRYEGDAFAGTPLLEVLHGESPLSVKNFALAQTAPGHWLTLGRTTEAVRRGGSQAKEALGTSLFEYYGSHPQEGALFSGAMTDLSTPVIREAVSALDMTNVTTVVDVGGADGAFVHALMEAHSHLRGSVLELPHAVPGAEKAAKRRGLESRFSAIAGDYLTAVPALGDLYLLKYILHDLDDERSIQVLKNCKDAMSPGGRIVVVEMVITEQDSGFAPLMDVAILTLIGGRERTEKEFDDLFAKAGLRRVRATEIQAPYSLIEAVAA